MTRGSTEIKWRGQTYDVKWSIVGAHVCIEVTPENAELVQIVKRDIEQDKFDTLPVSYGWGFKYLASDLHRGE
jgi:hypothetical protein